MNRSQNSYLSCRFATRYQSSNTSIKESILDFAALKLLNIEGWRHANLLIPYNRDAILACLSCRLGLSFVPLTQIRERQMVHIERHMRICKKISPDFHVVQTTAPSEPILAEAARMVMKCNKFDPVSALADEFRRPDVEKGPRGEALMKLLLALVSDMLIPGDEPQAWWVVDFLDKLIVSSSSFNVCNATPSCVHPRNKGRINSKTKFQEAFKHAKMYFNHWIKLSDSQLVNRDYLWRMILRGAAVECANNQLGIDLLIPFVYFDDALGEYNVSAILIQVKNDRSFSRAPQEHIFDHMDPYILKIFSEDDKDYAQGGLPVIRIVAALASPSSHVTNFTYGSPDNSLVHRDANAQGTVKTTYTAYDFWCAGLDGVWGAIKKDQINAWRDLLDCWEPDARGYKDLDNNSEENRRSQEPGKYKHISHWNRFSDMSRYEKASK
jgi:hypothetical protein